MKQSKQNMLSIISVLALTCFMSNANSEDMLSKGSKVGEKGPYLWPSSSFSQQDNNITFVNRWAYGPNYACSIHEPYAYIGNGGMFQILYISDLFSPTLIGETATPGIIQDIHIAGEYAYVATSASVSDHHPGLRIIDITDSSNPREVADLDVFGVSIYGVSVVGNYAYIANGWMGLTIIDVSDPPNPGFVGYCFTNGFAQSVMASGNYAYLSNGTEGVRIIDIQNPSAPSEVGFFNTGGYASRLRVNGNSLYVADEVGGLCVIDISIPQAPVEVGIYPNVYAYDVAVSGNMAYVAGGRLYVLDITNPQAPEFVSRLYTETHYLIGSGANRVCISGSVAYVADWFNGFHIIDISNALYPTEFSSFITKSYACDFKAEGTTGYLIDGAYGFVGMDLSDPSHPVEIMHLNPQDWGYSGSIEIFNDYLFVASGWGGVRIVDKVMLTEVGFYDPWEDIFNVTVSPDGKYLYVPAMSQGFHIVNIQNLAAPSLVGEYPVRGDSEFFDAIVQDDKAYLSDFNGSYYILDVSDISNPNLMSRIQTSVYGGNHIALNYPYLYAADGDSGLQVIDVSDPFNPVLKKTIPSNWGWNVQLIADYLWFYDSYNGIFVFDVTDPSNPIEVGSFNTVGSAFGSVFISGEYIYAADGNGGLYTFKSDLLTSIDGPEQALSMDYHLFDNYPNPFNHETTIRFHLPEPDFVTLKIFTILGEEIETLLNERKSAGDYKMVWRAEGLPSGIYFCRLRIGDVIRTKKLVLQK